MIVLWKKHLIGRHANGTKSSFFCKSMKMSLAVMQRTELGILYSIFRGERRYVGGFSHFIFLTLTLLSSYNAQVLIDGQGVLCGTVSGVYTDSCNF